ncbi:MAG: 23S rRNA (adenine(2503)-C(2))-methyltransferase RlmN [Candidatus Atribacteria bacterium]|nr:23S rRNA (adenine(2503)-C(2))-methyltransferase RlmN [Candidatus Atribacteria bacterium]
MEIEKKKNIKDLSLDELKDIVTGEFFEPSFRVDQVFGWIYRQKVSSFLEMKNLPRHFIDQLNDHFLLTQIKPIQTLSSQDGSVKFLFELSDGHLVESVLIRNGNRNTVCLSSQVGCHWHCLFCASGQDGFKRNLSTGEIIDQILSIMKVTNEYVHNVVFMGMGEPFDNYDQVMKSIQMMNTDEGLNIGARKITISTCGIIPGIQKLSNHPFQVELSVSLHSADDEIRSQLMPVNKKYPLKELIHACKKYVEKKRRQITFEYLMLKGINDSVEQANKLSHLISDFDAKVNLIIYNPIQNKTDLLPSEERAVSIFQAILKRNRIPVTIRYSKGQDIQAACGQLRSNYQNKLKV